MQNPWTALPDIAPYLLPSDKTLVEKFNNTRPHSDHLIHHELLPEPFLGNPDAPIVLLNGNPGYDPTDKDGYQKPEMSQLSRGNLVHANTDYSFYLLNPAIAYFGGYSWWTKKLKPLIDRSSQKTVANNILCVEYFPYHSRKAANFHKYTRIPSQEYSFHLVKKAINRGALIILMRWPSSWLGTIPELNTYPDFFRLNSPQNVIISPRNCPGGFEKILNVLNL